MEANLTQRESLDTQPQTQRQSLTRTLRANFPEYFNASRYDNDISAIPSSVEDSDDSDPFLLVSVSNSRRPPSRPKHLITLILIAIFDLNIQVFTIWSRTYGSIYFLIYISQVQKCQLTLRTIYIIFICRLDFKSIDQHFFT